MTPCLKLDSSAFQADEELIQSLERYAQPLECAEERVLFRQGEEPNGLYMLHTGEATLSMHAPNGTRVMCMQTFAGSVLGLPGLLGNEPYSLTATATNGSKVSFVGREAFLDLMQTHPTLSFKVLQILAAEVRAARTALH